MKLDSFAPVRRNTLEIELLPEVAQLVKPPALEKTPPQPSRILGALVIA